MGIKLNVLLFGAGKRGRYWLEFLEDYGIVPAGMIDNNQSLWGTLCRGIRVYGPTRLADKHFDVVFITCNDERSIYQQLLELGIDRRKIIVGRYNFLNHLLYYSAKRELFSSCVDMIYPKSEEKRVLFDLQNGMILGGVEAWSYDLAKRLKETGRQGLYLAAESIGEEVLDRTYPTHKLRLRGIEKQTDKVNLCIKEILRNLPCTVICNFPYSIFWSACIAKQYYPNQVRIIAVQHSDDQVYYDAYSLWQNSIDRCMVISSHIEHKLLSLGMEQNKIIHIKWKVPCTEVLDKVWSREDRLLRIGYAGRVTKIPKRIDGFLTLAQNLRGRGIFDFRITIAGTGDYSEILGQEIQERNLKNHIISIGCIDRKDIPAFWSRQDIMISCSEIEGHSISQSEAMAEGAVPVITDVSGARDDVTDGYNGFVVDVGDMESLTERICYLYHNRDVLEQMGRRAHETIYNRQKDMDETIFWDHLIKEVWQP